MGVKMVLLRGYRFEARILYHWCGNVYFEAYNLFMGFGGVKKCMGFGKLV